MPHIVPLTELDHCYVKVPGLTTKIRHLAIQDFRGINVPFFGECSKNSYTETITHLDLNSSNATIL